MRNRMLHTGIKFIAMCLLIAILLLVTIPVILAIRHVCFKGAGKSVNWLVKYTLKFCDVLVTIDGGWIGNRVCWSLTSRN
jgi:hypothetical protein